MQPYNNNTSISNTMENTMTKQSCLERAVPKFLKKLFYILEENNHHELISWSENGAAVIIKQPIEFAQNVLPLYFKHNNFASFIRQVILLLIDTECLYDFK